MKKLTLLLSFFAATQYVSAQITLSAFSYTSTVAGTTDTLKVANLSSVPAVTTGPNQTWDFSNVTYDSTLYQQHSNVPTGAFSATAQYADSVLDSTGYTYYYSQHSMDGIAASGLLDYGEHFDQQDMPIVTYVMSPADSFIILSQDVTFSNPIRNIAFPATYASHWTDAAHAIVHGKINVTEFQYSDSAFDFRYQYHTLDTVKGWGTLKVKNSAGIVTDVEVLQVKSIITRNDSTIVGGSQITESQHDFTGLPVGFPVSSYAYKYYAANEVTPIAEVIYQDYFVTPRQVIILSKNFPPATAVAEITVPGNIAVYPNPVNNHTFYISLPAGSSEGSYDVINASGQSVCSGKLPSGQTVCSVQLKKETASGIYYIRITNDGKVSIRKIIVE
jgi:hypothetical protein